jgi:hypothetical protein
MQSINHGLLDGLCGEVLLKIENIETIFNSKIDVINEINNLIIIFNSTNDYSLCSGKSGIYWFLNYINDKTTLHWNDKYKKQVEESIYNNFIIDLNNNYIDYLYGALGKLRVLLDVQSDYLVKATNLIIDFSINYLIKLKSTTDVDFGLAHGILSLINIICELDFENERKKIILTNYYSFLIEFENNDNKTECIFPLKLLNNELLFNSVDGWCYGDFIIILTLTKIYSITQNSDLFKKINDLTEKAIKKNKKYKSKSICHGYLGVILICENIFYITKNKELKYYIEKTKKTHRNLRHRNDYGILYGNYKYCDLKNLTIHTKKLLFLNEK